MFDIGLGPWEFNRPPKRDWYNASPHKKVDVLRYWNGRVWSRAITQNAPLSVVARAAMSPTVFSDIPMFWRPVNPAAVVDRQTYLNQLVNGPQQ